MPRKITKPKPAPRPAKPKRPAPSSPPEIFDVTMPAAVTELSLYQKQKNRVRAYQHEQVRMERDIAPLPYEQINWDLRNACQYDLKLFCENYLSATFYLEWSKDQLKCLAKAERVFLDTYKFALAMPRGGGKTATCRGAITWGTLYGHKRYPAFVGARADAAAKTLKAVKMQIYRNPLLLRDFPEICYPIRRIENRYHMAKGQLYEGEPTSIEWGSDEVCFPCLILKEEVAETYLKHYKDGLIYLENYGGYITKSSGVRIATYGIDGSIRGENQIHPLTMEEIRPDIVLLDDIQNDKKAKSPVSVANMVQLVDGAIEGLAGPAEGLSVLMPCTVIMEGDVADTFVDPGKRPDYNGERCKLVISWPPGITDTEITKDTPSAVAWNEYRDIRHRSLRIYGDNRLATEFYQANREVMDLNFVVSWEQRIVKKVAVSAQQNAMELRFKSPETFCSEYQNIGRSVEIGNIHIISAETLRHKHWPLGRNEIAVDCHATAAFIDVQDEFLVWGVAAASYDFTGAIVNYGTWPETRSLMFTRSQANSWNQLSNLFLKAHPQYLKDAVPRRSGRLKAPDDPKFYFAVTECLKMLRSLRLVVGDEHKTEVPIKTIGIDARHATDIIKQIVREARDPNLHACFGNRFPPTNKQLDEYQRTPGWIFEDTKNPLVEQVKWVRRIGADHFPYMSVDADLMKDFLFKCLGTAPGAPGGMSLFKDSPERHLMFAQQVCDSEYPEEVIAKGIAKNQWTERDNGPDNEYLDVAYNLMVMLAWQGCCVKVRKEEKQSKQKRSLRALWEKKRQEKQAS